MMGEYDTSFVWRKRHISRASFIRWKRQFVHAIFILRQRYSLITTLILVKARDTMHLSFSEIDSLALPLSFYESVW